MDRLTPSLRDALWPAIWIMVGLLATVEFFRDLGLPGVQSWGIAAVLVTSMTIIVLMLPRESIVRALIWFGTLAASAFLILYDVLDAIFDPIIYADWPIAGIALAVIIGLATRLLVMVTDEL